MKTIILIMLSVVCLLKANNVDSQIYEPRETILEPDAFQGFGILSYDKSRKGEKYRVTKKDTIGYFEFNVKEERESSILFKFTAPKSLSGRKIHSAIFKVYGYAFTGSTKVNLSVLLSEREEVLKELNKADSLRDESRVIEFLQKINFKLGRIEKEEWGKVKNELDEELNKDDSVRDEGKIKFLEEILDLNKENKKAKRKIANWHEFEIAGFISKLVEKMGSEEKTFTFELSLEKPLAPYLIAWGYIWGIMHPEIQLHPKLVIVYY